MIRILLPMQGTRVPSLVWKDSTCHRVTRAHVPQLLSLSAVTTEALLLEPVLCNKGSQHNKKPKHHN